jgi:hypothetical protein
MRTSGRLIVTENKVQSFRVAQHLDAGAKKKNVSSAEDEFFGDSVGCTARREKANFWVR